MDDSTVVNARPVSDVSVFSTLITFGGFGKDWTTILLCLRWRRKTNLEMSTQWFFAATDKEEASSLTLLSVSLTVTSVSCAPEDERLVPLDLQ